MNACKILVIDDDEDDVEILANSFLQSGVDAMHHVKTAMEAFMYLETAEQECLPKLSLPIIFYPVFRERSF